MLFGNVYSFIVSLTYLDQATFISLFPIESYTAHLSIRMNKENSNFFNLTSNVKHSVYNNHCTPVLNLT